MKTPQEEGPRSFARFIEGLAEGEAQRALADELHAVCVSLRDESDLRNAIVKGSVTLTLSLAAGDGMVAIDYDVKGKTPQPKRAKSVMWLTRGGNLTPHNPRQQKLPGIREVGGTDAPARELDTDNTPAREVPQ